MILDHFSWCLFDVNFDIIAIDLVFNDLASPKSTGISKVLWASRMFLNQNFKGKCSTENSINIYLNQSSA